MPHQDRYVVVNSSQLGHCCITSTVVDATKPGFAPGSFEMVCECIDDDDANLIARLLNQHHQENTVHKDLSGTVRAEAMMQPLGAVDGVQYYWAEPGTFERPGVYFWEPRLQKNVRVTAELVMIMLGAIQELRSRGIEVKAALDTGLPEGSPVHPQSARLTWPLSTAGMALRKFDEACR